MSLELNQNANTERTEIPRLEDGTFPARIAMITDLGKQHDSMWNAKTKTSELMYYVVGEDGEIEKNADGFAKKTSVPTEKPVIVSKVAITVEFPTETVESGGEELPRWMTKEYNVTSKGSLVKLVTSLKADATRVSDIAGLPCFVTVGSTSSGKAKVAAINPPMKRVPVPELKNAPVVFDMSKPDMEAFNKVPAFIQKKIKESIDFEKSAMYSLLNASGVNQGTAQQNMSDFDNDDQDRPF